MGELSTYVLVAAGCAMLALPLLVYAFSAGPDRSRRQILVNLNRDVRPTEDAVEVGGGFLASLAGRLATRRGAGLIDRLLARAGRPAAWPIERVLVTKIVATSVTIALVVLLISSRPEARVVVFGLAVVVSVWFLPELLLYNTALKRRTAVAEALPDTLDQLSVAVDAGLGFESALAHVARHSSGPLADEIVRTLQDIQVGAHRRDAYLAMGERVGQPDLRRFLRAMTQAEQHGISVANVLTTQAEEMRTRRRQRAEERAMQIPVKVVFPLVLFILPALFVVIMGPAAITMIDAFTGN